GLFTNRSQNSLDRVPDGTSNTLMFGEALGGVQDGVRLYAYSWMGRGFCVTYRGLHASHNPAPLPWHDFDSMHSGVVQFCFADGHVTCLKKGIGYWAGPGPFSPPQTPEWETLWILQELAGFRDGGTRDQVPAVGAERQALDNAGMPTQRDPLRRLGRCQIPDF